MLNVIALGLAIGAGIQAYRAYPPAAPFSVDAVAVVFIVGVVCAYLGGRWHGRGGSARATATATAVASSEASATAANVNRVQLAVIVPGQGAHNDAVRLPSESAPWLEGVEVRREITADDLEGMDLSDIFEPEQLPEPSD